MKCQDFSTPSSQIQIQKLKSWKVLELVHKSFRDMERMPKLGESNSTFSENYELSASPFEVTGLDLRARSRMEGGLLEGIWPCLRTMNTFQFFLSDKI